MGDFNASFDRDSDDLEFGEGGGWDGLFDGDCPECSGTGYDDGQCHMCGGTGTAFQQLLPPDLRGPVASAARSAEHARALDAALRAGDDEDDFEIPF